MLYNMKYLYNAKIIDGIFNRAYQSAEQNDLWYALTKQAHKDKVLDSSVTIKEIMDTWTLQTGFPVVTVSRNYNNSSITLTQVC